MFIFLMFIELMLEIKMNPTTFIYKDFALLNASHMIDKLEDNFHCDIL